MKRALCALSTVVLLLSGSAAVAGDDTSKEKDKEKETKAETKRENLDKMAQESLDRLFKESPGAKSLYDKAYGYAVFDTTKVALGLTGGGGAGVAVNKDSGERSYMRMGTAGIGLGIGAQNYQVIFLFENAQTFDNFVHKGWKAEASADAAAGTEGVSASATFTRGLAIYKLTDKGLMANADIAGTKYWQAKKLNE